MQSALETRLAAVLLGELFTPRQDLDDTYVDIILDDFDLDDDYYAAFELVREDRDQATTEFVRVRDTSRDHIVTVKFPREAIDIDTQPMPMYSAPYERLDIAEGSAPIVIPNEIDAIDASVPSERIELVDDAVPTPSIADGSARIVTPRAFDIPEPSEYENALPFPLYSAPFERVDLDVIEPTWPAEPTEMIMPARPRVFATIAILTCALALGIGIALLWKA
jgi:hypothetical protein